MKTNIDRTQSYLARWDHSFPEILCLALLFLGAFPFNGDALAYPVLIRALIVGSVAIHGLGHVLVAGGSFRTHLVAYTPRLCLRDLIPFQPIFIPGFSHPSRAPRFAPGALSYARLRAVALAGPAANAFVLLLLAPALMAFPSTLSLSSLALLFALSINLLILATSWSDYASALSGKGMLIFCGNFGILAKRKPGDRGFMPRRFRGMIEQLGQITDIRGQQAGGIAVLGAGDRFIGKKIVNDKRGKLTKNLLSAFARKRLMYRLLGARPMPAIFHMVAHYRYGTSSAPSIVETHWLRWSSPRVAPVWSIKRLTLARRRRRIENLITHNGDLNAWVMDWGRISVDTLGQWLTEVLEARNPAKGDSPKIAGLMDLLITQGQWAASLRLACAMQGESVLRGRSLKALSNRFDQVFNRWANGEDTTDEHRDPSLSIVGCNSLAEVYRQNSSQVQSLLEELWQVSLPLTSNWPDSARRLRRQVIEQAVYAFFHNDLYKAAQLFMSRAEGTFGLVSTSSLEPGCIVLSTEKQPLFVGAQPDAGLIIYASESMALNIAFDQMADGCSGSMPYRLGMRDGDIAMLRAGEDTADSTITVTNQHQNKPPTTERITPEVLAESSRDSRFTGWISLRDNPYIEAAATSLPTSSRDRVLAEMQDIPAVLDRLQREWDEPASLNRRTAQAFGEFLSDKAKAWQGTQGARGALTLNGDLDILVIGIENSLFLGEHFAEDVRRVFPYLHIEAVDAVSYCEDPQSRRVGPETITLALSQSGETFNTLDAVKFNCALHTLNKAGPVFVMTGKTDTLMGTAVGQSVKAAAPWVARLFSTGAGWRSAEPATVSSAATHASLTQLLLSMVRDVRASSPSHSQPFGLTASEDDLEKLTELARISRWSGLFGRSPEGWDFETEARERLKREGHYLSLLLIEPALVFIFTGLHLFVMLWLGWNPVIGALQLFEAALQREAFDAELLRYRTFSIACQTAYFLFAGLAFTLILRAFQRRPLWDRAFSGRTLVIGEERHIKNLLGQYVSKLFSLAYEFVGFTAVHAADTRSGELLHGYGHRVTRGLLLFLGVPDGRWPGHERAEASVLMTSSQARGVKSIGTGATVIGIGHNPASSRKVDRFILLEQSIRQLESLPSGIRDNWSDLARDLYESRFESFERLLSAYIIFHSAAAKTRDFMNRLVPLSNLFWAPVFLTARALTLGRVRPWFGYWDLARTQSGTRIATTAAPAPAITVDPRDYRNYKSQPIFLPKLIATLGEVDSAFQQINQPSPKQ